MPQMILDSHEIVNGKHWIGTSFEGGGCWIELPTEQDGTFDIITIPQYGGQPALQQKCLTFNQAMVEANFYAT